MKTYFLCLRKNELRGLHAEIAICDAMAPFGLEEENCKSFCSVENFFQCLSETSEEGVRSILAVDTELFLNTKSTLFSALSLNCKLSQTIADLIKPDVQNKDKHCEIPVGATVFPTEKGIFSGFAFKEGKYDIIFLPLSDEITQQCFSDALFNYLEPTCEVKAPPVENSEKDMSEVMNSIAASASDACRILRDMGFKVAISVSPSAEKLCGLLPEMEEIEFLPPPIERNNFSPKNYAAQLAREAASRSDVKIGASITNAFKVQTDGETKIFLCVAVADSEAAKVKKIYAQPDETPLALSACALETVLDMIKGQAVRGKTIINEDDEDKISMLAPSVETDTRKRIIIGTICAGATALVLCISIAVGAIIINHNKVPVSTTPGNTNNASGTVDDDSIDDEYKDFWDFLFSSDNDDEEEENNGGDRNEPDNGADENDGGNGSNHSTAPGETSAVQSTESGTGNSEPSTGTTQSPSEQPTGERPTETRPTETEPVTPPETTTEPTTQAPPDTEPVEPPTEPTTNQPSEPVTPPTEPSPETENDPAPQELPEEVPGALS